MTMRPTLDRGHAPVSVAINLAQRLIGRRQL